MIHPKNNLQYIFLIINILPLYTHDKNITSTILYAICKASIYVVSTYETYAHTQDRATQGYVRIIVAAHQKPLTTNQNRRNNYARAVSWAHRGWVCNVTRIQTYIHISCAIKGWPHPPCMHDRFRTIHGAEGPITYCSETWIQVVLCLSMHAMRTILLIRTRSSIVPGFPTKR